jgi:hypothetical protein
LGQNLVAIVGRYATLFALNDRLNRKPALAFGYLQVDLNAADFGV